MKKAVLFLEQQTWLSGAQRVLENVIASLNDDFQPFVAFPADGPFRTQLARRQIGTLLYPLGTYSTGNKSLFEKLVFCCRSVACALKLAAFARKHSIALMYINGPRCLPAAVMASQLTGCPLLFHLHLTLTRRSDITLVTRLAPFVSKIVACSHTAARPLLDSDPRVAEKIHVLYNPVSHLRTLSPAPPEPNPVSPHVTIGMVGRITESKGQQTLLEAVGALHPEQRDRIRLIFVGAPAPNSSKDAAYATRLRMRANELNLQDRIQWAGYQARPDSYFSQLDALVVASSSQAGEAMPMVILEALQKGIPVIASRTGEIQELIQNEWNGLLIDPGDTRELTQALARFLMDPALRLRLKRGAQAGLDERFSKDKFTSAIHELINNLIVPPTQKRVRTTFGETTLWD